MTLCSVQVSLADMGEKTLTARVKVCDGVTPDFTDCEVEYRGERYVLPVREPQGVNDWSKMYGEMELTFEHWAIRELKRWFFFTMQPVESGTAVPDKYVADVALNLGDFIDLLSRVTDYYYGEYIRIDLNRDWVFKGESTAVSLSYTTIWDVVKKLYELYGVRWSIGPSGDSRHYVIRVGYGEAELDHVFSGGFSGGLMKVERQLQSDEIRNMIMGRGGSENLPLRYFKDVDPANKDFRSDPDWVSELANIPFDRLRGATFRSYVQGWKAARKAKDGLYADYVPVRKEAAYSAWAWEKGFTDELFDPVEYVSDKILPTEDVSGDSVRVRLSPNYAPYVEAESSMAVYGPLLGALSDNDSIYPTIQGTGMDVTVDVEQITDEVSVPDTDVTISELEDSGVSVSFGRRESREVTTQARGFNVPSGRKANLIIDAVVSETHADKVVVESYTVRVVNSRGDDVGATGIPSGTYKYWVAAKVENTSDEVFTATLTTDGVRLEDAVLTESHGGCFDIWVKNIWGSEKQPAESDTAYSERVWKPILGDRSGEAKVLFTSGALSVSEDYEFIITSYPVYDTSREFEGERSHWRIRLAKSDADLESLGKYVPNEERNGRAGDTIVFLGTEMTHEYVLWAEQALDDYKQDECNKISKTTPTYVVSPDRVRLSGYGLPGSLLSRLSPGMTVRLEDKLLVGEGLRTSLYIQSLTISYREPTSEDAALNPDVEMVLGDDYTTTTSPIARLSGEVTALQRQIGSVSNVEGIVRGVGDRRYLRKDMSDRTPYKLQADGGIEVGDYVPAARGGSLDSSGNGDVEDMLVRGALMLKKSVGSSRFVSGFGGEGFRVYKTTAGIWEGELDKLTVRQSMVLYELIIQKLRSVGGEICVSQANGKIKAAQREGLQWRVTFETSDHGFASHDLIRCQTFSGGRLKYYWVEADAVTTDGDVLISATEFAGQDEPAPGDECVLMGNTADRSRSSVVLISASGTGEPVIDVLDGIQRKSTEGCLRARLGGLDGIDDICFGKRQPKGYGLYSDNAYLKGEFVLSTGENVATKFEVTEGLFKSEMKRLDASLSDVENILSNPTFDGATRWYGPSGNAGVLSYNGSFLSMSERYVSDKADGLQILSTGGVRLGGGEKVIQFRGDFALRPKTGDEYRVYVYVEYEDCVGGELTVRAGSSAAILGVNAGSGSVEQEILWDGSGDYEIETDCAITLKRVRLSSKSAADTVSYRTMILQTAEAIKLQADKIENVNSRVESNSASISVMPDNILLTVKEQIYDEKTGIGSAVKSKIEQTAGQISLSVKDGLKETGIDIDTKQITFKANVLEFIDGEGYAQALFENGKLNVKALEATERVVVRKSGDTEQRVEIVPEAGHFGVNIYDNNGNRCQSLTGDSHANGASDFFGDAVESEVMMTSASNIGESSTPDVSRTIVLSEEWESATPVSVRITGGTLVATAMCNESVDGIIPRASGTLRVCLQRSVSGNFDEYEEVEIATASNRAFTGNETPLAVSTDLTGKTANMGGSGRYRLVLYSNVYAVNGSAKVRWSGITAVKGSEVYMSHYYANGMTLGCAANDYFDVHYTPDGGVEMTARSKYSGIRAVRTGLHNMAGGEWGPMPRMLCHAVAKYGNGFSMTYKGVRFGGNPIVTFNAATGTNGRVELRFTDAAKAALGEALSEDNLIVHVSSKNPTVPRSVTSISDVSIITDSFNGTFSDFTFEIYIL